MVAIAVKDLTKIFPDGTMAVDHLTFQVDPGEFLVLLGPTGCGKSTVLRLIAGLEQPTSGHIYLDDQLIDAVPSHERRVAMVFQDVALYPHLTVADNIAFPLRLASIPEVTVSARVVEVARQLGLTSLLTHLPSQLSGGQRQRVAMARALVRNPVAFLLDEPLSNVDAGMRAELRSEIVNTARQIGATAVYVTHDQAEAMSMADRIAVLRRGALQQIGTPVEIYNNPDTIFVAAFVGSPRINLLQAAVYAEAERTVIDLGTQVITIPWSDPWGRALAVLHTARVTVGIRPEAMTLTADTETDAALDGVVRHTEYLGHESVLYVDTGSLPVVPSMTQLDLPPGLDLGTPAAHRNSDRPQSGPPGQDPVPTEERASFALYPAYQSDSEHTSGSLGDVVVRLPRVPPPRVGSRVTLMVDPRRLLLFDQHGARIRPTI